MAEKVRVAVIYGGNSPEHSISCISAAAVMSHLDTQRYEVIPVGVTRRGRWVVGTTDPAGDAELPEVAEAEEIALSLDPEHRGALRFTDGRGTYATADVFFPVLHGPCGEDGTIQGLFELAGVPYVGPGVLASACGMDKEYTKKLVVAAGLPVTAEVVLRGEETLTEEQQGHLGLPVFVKPARGGSSIGISKVERWEDLAAAVELARRQDTKVIVEAEITGAEVEVGVLEYPDGTLVASEPARLIGTEDSEEGFYGFDTKYLDNVVSAEIPAQLPAQTIAQLKDMALTAFRALNCKGLARVDFFATESGPMLNEINTLPGFTPISMYPKVFAASGVEYQDLLGVMVDTALASGQPTK
ncbi:MULTISPECIES: D-alanine--D-alanine ligase family protein [unclassified Corynebacterium]|uniref:D-alanine--D-alanine ligase family protein n=1 Tax=unclassified Corynebacterium TaxID=2624378 RepID=UPI0029CA65E4|nr:MULTISPECIES: D-alanine--D-alanine ligase family protein [unclassified Corynebacterium]WPF67262.1 D-alanine--D-alanine ligase family protein [Corynebacterium sp. 22KM0430]WPF69752.1 D-alanine--D-alanine ligase family protein [Corynebacterium sp. 21KM1197]